MLFSIQDQKQEFRAFETIPACETFHIVQASRLVAEIGVWGAEGGPVEAEQEL